MPGPQSEKPDHILGKRDCEAGVGDETSGASQIGKHSKAWGAQMVTKQEGTKIVGPTYLNSLWYGCTLVGRLETWIRYSVL